MRNGLIGVIFGAVVALIVAYVLWAPRGDGPSTASIRSTPGGAVADAPLPRYGTVLLRRGNESARCTATINYPQMGGKPKELVGWFVEEHTEEPCNPSGPWAVHLIFEGAELPFPLRDIRIGRAGRQLPIKNDASYGPRKYKVWMKGHFGFADYEIVDPDLEVEPPGNFVPPAAPPGNPPADPPATPPGNPGNPPTKKR
jgi:hypothetical protein